MFCKSFTRGRTEALAAGDCEGDKIDYQRPNLMRILCFFTNIFQVFGTIIHIYDYNI